MHLEPRSRRYTSRDRANQIDLVGSNRSGDNQEFDEIQSSFTSLEL